MSLCNRRISIVLLLILSVIASNSIIGETVYAKKTLINSTKVQQAKSVPDNSQSINKRLGELQAQIDELRRQIQNLPPIGKPVVTQRSVDFEQTPFNIFFSSKASCNSDEVVVGGGFDTGVLENSHVSHGPVPRAEFMSDNGWLVVAELFAEDPDQKLKAFVECLKIVP